MTQTAAIPTRILSGAYRFSRQDTVIYGRAVADAVAELAARYGAKRLLIVTTRSLAGADGAATKLAAKLGALCVGVHANVGAHSPREDVLAGAMLARETRADLLVAIGGGSAIDAAKVMQLCLWADVTEPAQLDPWRAGRGDDRRDPATLKPGVRMIAAPTTLSAAEFTPFAGVTDTGRRVKEGFTHPDLAPLGVILDPAITLATPPRLWLSTGIKAVDHAVEQLCHPERSPVGDALAAEGLRLLGAGLPACHANPGSLEARALCQHGMWLAISGAASGRGMGPSHAIGHTLGGSYRVPHGITSCITLHAVLTWNAKHDPLRQALVSRLLDRKGVPAATAVRELVKSLGLPTQLAEVSIGRSHFRAIAEHAMHDRGVRNNARPIRGVEDVMEILELAA